MAGMDELLAVGWRRRTMDSRKVAGNSLMAWAAVDQPRIV